MPAAMISLTSYEISLSPSGRLLLAGFESEVSSKPDSWIKKLFDAFKLNQSAGLFALGASRPTNPVSPSISYWREFACRFLTELCQTPDSTEAESIAIPALPDLEKMVLNAPPMRGAEYLSTNLLSRLWSGLNEWVQQEVESSNASMSNWLKEHAPQWHHVGRVCFHLAENTRNNDFPFAFLATYAPRISAGGRVQYQPLNKALTEYAGERNKKALINLLSPVHLASEKSDLVRELLETSDLFHPLMWTPPEAHRFLKEVPKLEESGLLVRLPDWWRKRAKPRVAVTIGEKKQNSLGVDAMLDFKAELLLGDVKLSQDEMQQILSANDGLIFLRGQWVEVDSERLSEALAHWQQIEQSADNGISFIEGMRLLAGASADLGTSNSLEESDEQWAFVNAGDWLSEILHGLRDPARLLKQKTNNGLRGNLRPYQQTGHDWLSLLSSLGLGACLADDMGLGKTIQVLSLLLSIKATNKQPHKPSLLVLPASLLANWKSEMQRFAPTLSARFIHASEISEVELATISEDPTDALAKTDVVFTTYGMLLRQNWLLDVHWRLVVLDEAQAIKNPGTNQTKTVKKLKGESRIALTGTPVENRLSDLWSLFDFLSPGLLGSSAKFKAFVKSLDERENNRYAPLRNLVGPYILRRLKSDKSIIEDLPDKTEMKVFCGLTKHQTALYSKSVEELARTLKEVDGMKRRGLVLAFLLRFKQICNHPSQFLSDGRYDPLHSGKFERLKSICEEIASRQEKVLVFSQFREITEPISTFLTEVFNQPGLVLHGGTPVAKRRGIVERFQQEDGPPFAVLTVKAGGTGLNLTAASHVVHFDRWWNPAVENQATDRAYRIGQHRNVLVHKFICRGTIEDKIDAMITEKSELAEGILTGGAENILTEMSDKELLDIVSLDIERVLAGEA
ncbi:MAG: DEAD/DEAH box helicase [Candidatus Obscuribacterales bacterium]|nr:DEAD/DEAH box helicase [Candidatus Obscuribacterales bacterium]